MRETARGTTYYHWDYLRTTGQPYIGVFSKRNPLLTAVSAIIPKVETMKVARADIVNGATMECPRALEEGWKVNTGFLGRRDIINDVCCGIVKSSGSAASPTRVARGPR
jgi:hypothetical protein